MPAGRKVRRAGMPSADPPRRRSRHAPADLPNAPHPRARGMPGHRWTTSPNRYPSANAIDAPRTPWASKRHRIRDAAPGRHGIPASATRRHVSSAVIHRSAETPTSGRPPGAAASILTYPANRHLRGAGPRRMAATARIIPSRGCATGAPAMNPAGKERQVSKTGTGKPKGGSTTASPGLGGSPGVVRTPTSRSRSSPAGRSRSRARPAAPAHREPALRVPRHRT